MVKPMFPKLKEIIDNSLQIDIKSTLDSALIRELQAALKIDTDGIVGDETLQALADFKHDKELEFPFLIGASTAKLLLETGEDTGEQPPDNIPQLNPKAGEKSGSTMRLPSGKLVFGNEFVVPGIPLTWGEVTKDCTRVPTSGEYVENAIRLAKAWGGVREAFGSPIAITSGYRPPRVNSSVGGVRNSQHLYFRALDMKPLNGDYRGLWRALEQSSFSGLGDAVFRGRNKGFFHADIRPGGRTVFAY